MQTGSVSTLLLAFELRKRMASVPKQYRNVSLEECDNRIGYWANQVVQRVNFAADLMEGLRP